MLQAVLAVHARALELRACVLQQSVIACMSTDMPEYMRERAARAKCLTVAFLL